MKPITDRERDALVIASRMALAGHHRDLGTVYRVWGSTDAEVRADVVAALAQLPSGLLEAAGADPEQDLTALAAGMAAAPTRKENTDDR